MAEVKTWTVEEIERTATGERWHADYARMQGASGAAYLHDRSAAMLRAFAAQTRQVEQMREWLRGEECDSSPIDNGMKTAKRINQKFAALFPKDGAQ